MSKNVCFKFLVATLGFYEIASNMSPTWTPYDRSLRKQYNFFSKTFRAIHLAASKTKLKKGEPIRVYCYVSNSYSPEKVEVLQWLQTKYNSDKNEFPSDFMQQFKSWCDENESRKKNMKLLMQFGSFMKAEALERGDEALAENMAFDQEEILNANKTFIVKSLYAEDMEVINITKYEAEGKALPGDKKTFNGCVPGKVTTSVYNPK